MPPSDFLIEADSVRLTLNPSYLADRPKEILRNVSFQLERGHSLAILGETASGKSLLLRSLTRFLPEVPVRELEGTVMFEGKNLLRTSQSRLLNIRGSRIAYVLQDAHSLFHPLLTIRQHFNLILRRNQRKLANPLEHTIQYLYRVGIVEPETILFHHLYPEELDTATRQKLMIAAALVSELHLLIADELTAEFDSTCVAHIAALFEQLKKDRGMSILVATGRTRRAEQFGDRISILADGELVESSSPRELFAQAQHPATRTFIDGTLLAGSHRERLVSHYYKKDPKA